MTSGIFTAHSGLPLTVLQGDGGFGGNPLTGAIPLRRSFYGKGVHAGVVWSNHVGVSGDPAKQGTGLNLFADPELVYNNFRPVMPSRDRRHGRGALRGLSRWNLDWTLGREMKLTEKVKFTFSVDFINAFNHVIFNDPALSLLNPDRFGVLDSQFNTPRRIQFGARIDF